jgi:6-pyruvoyltetrahydropterin/6-carboxytetrahydropterin synthase
MKIVRSIEIDYGHTLPHHYGFCNQIHGHRAKIECVFEGVVQNDIGESDHGMVMDFSICKKIMMQEIHEVLDHGFAIWNKEEEDFVMIRKDTWTTNPIPYEQLYKFSLLEIIRTRNSKVLELDRPPTAEVLGEYFFGKIEKALTNLDSLVKLVELVWWETPNNRAIVNEKTKY